MDGLVGLKAFAAFSRQDLRAPKTALLWPRSAPRPGSRRPPDGILPKKSFGISPTSRYNVDAREKVRVGQREKDTNIGSRLSNKAIPRDRSTFRRPFGPRGTDVSPTKRGARTVLTGAVGGRGHNNCCHCQRGAGRVTAAAGVKKVSVNVTQTVF